MRDAQASLEAFVSRRLGESADRFPNHVKEQRRHLRKLIQLLAIFDPDNPDCNLLKTIVFDDDLLAALRYVTAPPVSEDDLMVLVTRRPVRLSRRLIEQEPQLLDEDEVDLLVGRCDAVSLVKGWKTAARQRT